MHAMLKLDRLCQVVGGHFGNAINVRFVLHEGSGDKRIIIGTMESIMDVIDLA